MFGLPPAMSGVALSSKLSQLANIVSPTVEGLYVPTQRNETCWAKSTSRRPIQRHRLGAYGLGRPPGTVFQTLTANPTPPKPLSGASFTFCSHGTSAPSELVRGGVTDDTLYKSSLWFLTFWLWSEFNGSTSISKLGHRLPPREFWSLSARLAAVRSIRASRQWSVEDCRWVSTRRTPFPFPECTASPNPTGDIVTRDNLLRVNAQDRLKTGPLCFTVFICSSVLCLSYFFLISVIGRV